jgi:MFS family permease
VLERWRWAVLAVLLTAPALAVLDGFIVTVALPSIQVQLRVGDADVQLVIAAYLVAYAALLITGGRLGDLYGRRRLLLVGLAAFGASSLVAAVAPTEQTLVLARAGQGAGAALMYPQALGQIRVLYGGRDRALAMTAFGVTLGLVAAAAPTLGGLILQADLFGLGWRPIFLINAPITVGAIALAARIVPETRSREDAAAPDLIGMSLLAMALAAVVFPLIVGRQLDWPGWMWLTFGGAAVMAAVFAVHERRATSPLLAFDLFRIRAFRRGLMTTLLVYSAQLPFFILLTVYLQLGRGLRPLAAGLVVGVVAVGFATASLSLPSLRPRLGRHVLTVGTITVTFSAAALATLTVTGSSSIGSMLPVLALIGAGLGLIIPALVLVVLDEIPSGSASAAAGALTTGQQLSAALGLALSGAVFYGLLHASAAPQYGLSFALVLTCDVALFGAAAVLVQGIGDAS